VARFDADTVSYDRNDTVPQRQLLQSYVLSGMASRKNDTGARLIGREVNSVVPMFADKATPGVIFL
jgi:hypothetical protein